MESAIVSDSAELISMRWYALDADECFDVLQTAFLASRLSSIFSKAETKELDEHYRRFAKCFQVDARRFSEIEERNGVHDALKRKGLVHCVT